MDSIHRRRKNKCQGEAMVGSASANAQGSQCSADGWQPQDGTKVRERKSKFALKKSNM